MMYGELQMQFNSAFVRKAAVVIVMIHARLIISNLAVLKDHLAMMIIKLLHRPTLATHNRITMMMNGIQHQLQ